jgi:flagellar assembly protein FliH
MSNLWRQEVAGTAASVGSFAIGRAQPQFRAWGQGSAILEDDPLDLAPEAEPEELTSRALAYGEGHEDGRREALAELEAERAALHELAAGLSALRPEAHDGLAAVLGETVFRLVRQIVGEVEVDGGLLQHRAEAAARLVANELSPAELRIHPADVALLNGTDLGLKIAADPSLARGSVRIATAAGWIEDGPEIRLERLRAELDRLGA